MTDILRKFLATMWEIAVTVFVIAIAFAGTFALLCAAFALVNPPEGISRWTALAFLAAGIVMWTTAVMISRRDT